MLLVFKQKMLVHVLQSVTYRNRKSIVILAHFVDTWNIAITFDMKHPARVIADRKTLQKVHAYFQLRAIFRVKITCLCVCYTSRDVIGVIDDTRNAD